MNKSSRINHFGESTEDVRDFETTAGIAATMGIAAAVSFSLSCSLREITLFATMEQQRTQRFEEKKKRKEKNPYLELLLATTAPWLGWIPSPHLWEKILPILGSLGHSQLLWETLGFLAPMSAPHAAYEPNLLL